MKIPQLQKKLEVKSCHDVSWEDNYSWIHQKNILEVLRDSSKLLPDVKKYLEEGYTTNVFQPHANEMILRPKIQSRVGDFEDGSATELDSKQAKKKDIHPLEEFTLDEYTLVLTMQGTSQPKTASHSKV